MYLAGLAHVVAHRSCDGWIKPATGMGPKAGLRYNQQSGNQGALCLHTQVRAHAKVSTNCRRT